MHNGFSGVLRCASGVLPVYTLWELLQPGGFAAEPRQKYFYLRVK